MKLPQNMIKKAIQSAEKSTYHQRLGCILFVGSKRLLSSGYNSSLQSRKSITKEFIKYSNSIHAEVAAIINAKTNLVGASAVIVRLNNKGSLLLAKPCKECVKYLTYVKIKRVFYSTNGGGFEELRL